MERSTVETLVRKTLLLGEAQNQFCWQGGEPTSMGIDFFREVIQFQRQYAYPGQVAVNSIQTNGVLLNEEWADFLAENNFLVGLSMDGPKDIHDRYRRTPSGKGTFDRVVRSAELLKSRGVQFNILTLLTDANVSRPEEIYRFFYKGGFKHLQFIPCFECDPVSGEPCAFSITGAELGEFYCRLFDLWMRNGFPEVSIRAFEDPLIFFIDGVHVSCSWQERCGSYLVVEYNGDVYPCDFYVYPEWKIGNIVDDSFAAIFRSPRFSEFSGMKTALPRVCRECKWISFCNGDCVRLRGSGPENRSEFCSASRMLLEHMQPHFGRIWQIALNYRRKQQGGAPGGVGRNASCPCGSGLKYKKCCGR